MASSSGWTLEQYYVEEGDEPDSQQGPYSYEEARTIAEKRGLRVVCCEFEYTGSYTVDDFAATKEGAL